MNPDECAQMALEHEERQTIIQHAISKGLKAGIITKDEAWAIGYESGIPLKLEEA